MINAAIPQVNDILRKSETPPESRSPEPVAVAAPNTPTGDRASRNNGSPLTNIPAARSEFHDYRDRDNPLEKVHPDPQHWSRWSERSDMDERMP